MTKWEKEPCISCPIAQDQINNVTDLLKKLQTCKACEKAEQDGGAK